ncbi:MAG TPA: TadE/TadG family type IV pilus assembly protein [Pirellulaceae bacterium]|nr:TadE/TadG family type IV pilus assembly protein [Pirellulaceae bacterium]
MLGAARHKRRRGTTTVEFAITCPIVFFLIFATAVGGIGVFRYQQVAAAAREGARWASVHGGQYAEETDQPAATAADIYSNAILPAASALNPSQLSYQVTWDKSNMPLDPGQNYEQPTGNTVTVTVTYQWLPEMYLPGPITLSSTSTAQMVY